MKRENFIVKMNGEVKGVKHAWNSSRRFVEQLIQQFANENSEDFKRTHDESEKERVYRVRGRQIWQGSNGSTVIFEIEKEAQ